MIRADGAHLALVGTTASGKSALALALARSAGDIEIVSVDSMQVYRRMDIGTAKATPAEQAEVPHHLLDVVEPHEEFSVSEFQRQAAAAVGDIEARGHRALLVGGTGLHLRAVVDGLDIPGRWPEIRAALEAEADTEGQYARLAVADPEAAARIEPGNTRRIVRALEVTEGSGRPFSSFGPGLDTYPPTRFRMVGLRRERSDIDMRIHDRLRAQMEAGFLDEVRALAAEPLGLSRTARQALGYRELLTHVEEGVDLGAAVTETERRTRAFARRQESWFRRDPRIEWVEPVDNPVDAIPGLLVDWVGHG